MVERDHTVAVRRDEVQRVTRNRTIFVGNDRCDDVLHDHEDRVRHHRNTTIDGDFSTRVAGNCVDFVSKSSERFVGLDSTVRIAGRERHEVTGTADLLTIDDATHRARGCVTTIVGEEAAKRSYTLHVEGVASVLGSQELVLTSDKMLTLKVGKSSIKISEDKIRDRLARRRGDGRRGRHHHDQGDA